MDHFNESWLWFWYRSIYLRFPDPHAASCDRVVRGTRMPKAFVNRISLQFPDQRPYGWFIDSIRTPFAVGRLSRSFGVNNIASLRANYRKLRLRAARRRDLRVELD